MAIERKKAHLISGILFLCAAFCWAILFFGRICWGATVKTVLYGLLTLVSLATSILDFVRYRQIKQNEDEEIWRSEEQNR